MSSKITSCYTHISDNTHQPSTRNKDSENVPPYPFQFCKKGLVILDMPQLIRILIILFEIPIGG